MIKELADFKYKFIQDENFDEYLSKLIAFDKPLMLDLETIGLYGKIRLAQFYQEDFEMPILVEYPDIHRLANLLNKCIVVCHRATYDISTIQENLGKIPWRPRNIEDTFYLSRLFFYNKEKFKLDECITYALGYNPYHKLNSDKSDLQKSDWDNPVLSEEQKLYAAFDVYYMYALWKVVKQQKDDKSYKLDIMTLKSNLMFQRNGLPVNIARVNKRFENNQNEIDKIALPINCNSYQQVRAYIDSDKSDDEGLAELSAQGNERAVAVRQTRKLTKENSFLKKYSTDDGKIYGMFSPSARSGRSTCSNQNLQQLPRSTKECFGVEENGDEVMVYSDFSQLELRCICAITGDTEMKALFNTGIDIHSYTAERLFNTNKLTKKQRQIAKTCNFGLLYGAGVNVFMKVLLKSTGVLLNYDEASVICRRWKNLWPAVKEWQQKGIKDWRNKTPWQTPLGRRYTAKMMTDQLNIQVQGMGAEVAKLANIFMEDYFNDAGYEWRLWQRNFIHDSYIFVLPNNEQLYKKVCTIIANSMQEAWFHMSKSCKIKNLPMPTKVSVGYNWGDIDDDGITVYIHKQ
jgi:DNA polymerase I-like protein with 3'-5' exonuclease and polymerase domains